jgi:hypothetical protein
MSIVTKPTVTEKATFHWDDPLRLDLQLTEVEKEVQQKAFEYAQGSLLPRAKHTGRRIMRTSRPW